MSLPVLIIAAMLIIGVHQLLLNKVKPISRTYFYIQLFASLTLVALAWFTKSEGKVEYKILLTVMASISIVQTIRSYQKRRTSSR